MSTEIAPPALAHLVDFAERPRVSDWSLRSALVRYAQPQPERVNRVLEVVRRMDSALAPHARLLEQRGMELWHALESAAVPASTPDTFVVALLQGAARLDRLADLLASWAADPSGERPDTDVDAVVVDVGQRLDDLGVAREELQRPDARRA